MRTVILAILLLAGNQAVAADDPVSIIETTTEELSQLIDEKRSTYRDDPQTLRADVKEILLPTIDQTYSARLVLGRHGRGKSGEQIDAFAEALANQLLNRYATALLDYDLNDRVEILPLAGENTERQTRVRTRVMLDNGERAPVDYVMRKTDDGWQVFDVIVEGISYVATFRSQIDQEIRQSSFEDMLERLESGQYEVSVDE
ncbi:MlaC/ttg2D family ABC transporter substrate-binding protein [Wenzhouxiangella sediminis]|uniref:ABC transporter substrate-binding protein n=1 Tax=Wenzhouxiangella sediminis TaxID=1792836 RepID=A0A3E1K646_9GAMM|nr:ABC transporter substrate-binding protein [Wenzhouxiangella sediminis]RFF29438.1 ABC transporter substrate-binding protein [Wenzhouxiangella sediminis]